MSPIRFEVLDVQDELDRTGARQQSFGTDTMGYVFHRDEKIQTNVQRIANEQIDRALYEIDDSNLDYHETVHQIRKRCKKIRGLLRIVRPQLKNGFQENNRLFRDIARSLSDVRDAHSKLESFKRIEPSVESQINLRTARSVKMRLQFRRDQIDHPGTDLRERLFAVRSELQSARERIPKWTVRKNGFDAMNGGLKRTFRRARKAFAIADLNPSTESFHELRKRVKYHGYHAKLLRILWPELFKAYRSEVNLLGQLLGHDHDFALLGQTIEHAPSEFGGEATVQILQIMISQHRSRLRTAAIPLSERIFHPSPGKLVSWLSRSWEIWNRKESSSDERRRENLSKSRA